MINCKRKNITICLISFFILSTVGRVVWANMTATDPGFEITSDFGPRLVGSLDFHKAIDYHRGAGETIPLLENGQVEDLARGTGNLFRIEIRGNHTFRYLHMFNNNSLPITSGIFTLTNSDNGHLCIIKWTSGYQGSRADYIISQHDYSGETVTLNSIKIRNANDSANATTSGTLTQTNNPYVGPAGVSGDPDGDGPLTQYAAHMHIDMGAGVSENPLYHINHSASTYNVEVRDKNSIKRSTDWIVKKDDSNTTFLKVYTNTITGKDLDKLKIYVDQIDSNHLVREFSYGGQTPEYDPINTDIENGYASNGLTDGVQPSDSDGKGDSNNNGESEVGYENFVYNSWESINTPESARPSKLTDGQHNLIVRAIDIEGNNYDTSTSFTIDTSPPDKWEGTSDRVDKETNPGNLILAKTQGGNNFDYVYTCDALPDEVGWQRVSYKGTPTIAIENGQLRIETKYRDAFDRDGVTYWKSCENEPISWTDNFTLEYKLNIDNFNNTSNLWFRGACWYGSTIITYYWDDYSGYEVWYNNDILSYNFMGAHIYRVVFRNEGGTEKMDLYIDGEKKATHEHSFGAFGFEIACNSDVTMLMDYFAYTQGAYTPAEKSVFDSSKYVSSGTYTSEVEDIGQVVDWDKISWVSECPVGTSVVWQTRTSNDNITWSEWSQEYTNSSGNDITSPDGRYIQKKAKLNTTDISQTPILKDVNITYHIDTPPTTPANLVTTTYADRIDLVWSPSPESDVAGYNVYRAASPYIKINPILITTTYYSDTTVEYGINYKYVVTAVDNAGNESTYQEQPVTATIDILDIMPYAAFSSSGIKINGQGKIKGNIKSNTKIELTGQAIVEGNTESDTITIKGKSSITGTKTENAQPVNTNPINLNVLQEKISQNNDNTQIPQTTQGKPALINGVLTLTGLDTLTITTGTYYLQGINLSDQTKLNINGKIEILCTGKIELIGHSKILDEISNTNNLTIYNNTTQPIQISGQTELQGIIYAPESNIIITGQSIIAGNIHAKSIELTGKGIVIGEESKEQMKLYITPELAPSPAFVKGEVYAYPNPAKNGYQPTMHIECGIADSVEIQIYNIAGELINNIDITQSIIKNNKYAYEYTWDISGIASGVYLYIIKAHKTGEDTIKVLKKMAIVR